MTMNAIVTSIWQIYKVAIVATSRAINDSPPVFAGIATMWGIATMAGLGLCVVTAWRHCDGFCVPRVEICVMII